MNNVPVRFERRPAQRFCLHLPVSVRRFGEDRECSGFTQDLSSRGVLLYTELPAAVDDVMEVTFMMPSEITQSDAMRVKCRGKVVRVAAPSGGAAWGVAVRIEGYEFLQEPQSLDYRTAAFASSSNLASRPNEEGLAESPSSVESANPTIS